MPLARKIKKADYDAFTGADEWKKNVYKLEGQDYVLDAEKDEDVGAALRARDFANTERDDAKNKLSELQAKYDSLNTEFETHKKKDPKTDKKAAEVEEDYKGRLATLEEKHKNELKAANDRTIKQMTDSFANQLAREITVDDGAAELLAPKIASRLDIDLTGPDAQLFITKDGKRSATTRDELRQEFVDNASYKSIIKASHASGGGAGSNGEGSGGGAPKALKDMTEAERVAFHKSNPQGFQQALTALESESAPSL